MGANTVHAGNTFAVVVSPLDGRNCRQKRVAKWMSDHLWCCIGRMTTAEPSYHPLRDNSP